MVELSLVIPAYNEEKNLPSTVKQYVNFLDSRKIGYEIILVPNNCSDNTPEIAEHLASDNNQIHVINIPEYSGKGGAVKKGFRACKGKLAGFVDADNSLKPAQFWKLVENIQDYDCVIASRSLKDSKVPVKQGFLRQILGTSFRHLVNILFSLNVADTQCGGKLFKKEPLKKVLPEIKHNGWEFDVELLWKLKQNGFSFREIAVEWKDSDISRVNFLAPLHMFIGIIKIRIGR